MRGFPASRIAAALTNESAGSASSETSRDTSFDTLRQHSHSSPSVPSAPSLVCSTPTSIPTHASGGGCEQRRTPPLELEDILDSSVIGSPVETPCSAPSNDSSSRLAAEQSSSPNRGSYQSPTSSWEQVDQGQSKPHQPKPRLDGQIDVQSLHPSQLNDGKCWSCQMPRTCGQTVEGVTWNNGMRDRCRRCGLSRYPVEVNSQPTHDNGRPLG